METEDREDYKDGYRESYRESYKDRYREAELKYRRLDVMTRGIGAFAAIASAIAAFLALRGYTNNATAVPQPASPAIVPGVTAPGAQNSVGSPAVRTAPVPGTTSTGRPTQTAPAAAPQQNDDDDQGDDRNEVDDE